MSSDSQDGTLHLPEGWASARAREVMRTRKGKKPDLVTGGALADLIPYIDIAAFESGRAKRYARPPSSVLVKKGDVLVVWDGARCGLSGRAPEDGALGSTLAQVSSQVLTPEYCYWFLKRHFETLNTRHRGTGIPHVDPTVFFDLSVPFPPTAEQQRITGRVEALFERVNVVRDRLSRVPTTLRLFRRSVLAAGCSGLLTEDWRSRFAPEPAHSIPGGTASDDIPNADELQGVERPKTWALARADALVRIQSGRAFPSGQYQDTGIRLLRPGNLDISGGVQWTADNTACLPTSWADKCPDLVLGKGELLVNLTAQSLRDEFLGRACIKEDAEPALLNQRIARLVPLGQYDIRPYLLLYLKSKFFRSFVAGLDTGSLIRHMHARDIARHVVPLPPFAEQLEIVRRVEALLNLADVVERRCDSVSASAARLVNAILAKGFSGDLVPTEAEMARHDGRDYEPASVLMERTRRRDEFGSERTVLSTARHRARKA